MKLIKVGKCKYAEQASRLETQGGASIAVQVQNTSTGKISSQEFWLGVGEGGQSLFY
jgi:hypothetical protein